MIFMATLAEKHRQFQSYGAFRAAAFLVQTGAVTALYGNNNPSGASWPGSLIVSGA
jgi:ABC-type Na+ transport system ATPase subunit NatA